MLKQAAKQRLQQGKDAYSSGDLDSAFRYFEDAHILGQRSTLLHTQSHWWMLKTAWRSHLWAELLGQIPRMFASLVFSQLWVPSGNSGRTNVSAFQSMPIPKHLQAYFDE